MSIKRATMAICFAVTLIAPPILGAQQREDRPENRGFRVVVPPPPGAAIRDRRAPVKARGVDRSGNPFKREDVLEKFRNRIPGSSPVEPVIIFNK